MKSKFLPGSEFRTINRTLLIILFAIAVPFQLIAQKKILASTVDKSTAPYLSAAFKQFTLFNINTAEIKNYADANGKGFSEFEFEFPSSKNFAVSIYAN